MRQYELARHAGVSPACLRYNTKLLLGILEQIELKRSKRKSKPPLVH